jgi:hypothetical protein
VRREARAEVASHGSEMPAAGHGTALSSGMRN